MRRQTNENDGQGGQSLGDRYSSVAKLDIQMEFSSPEGHILDSTHKIFKSSDSLDLWATCPGRCGNGRFDLEMKISQIVNSRQTSFETKDICNEVIHVGANDACKSELRCKIQIDYLAIVQV